VTDQTSDNSEAEATPPVSTRPTIQMRPIDSNTNVSGQDDNIASSASDSGTPGLIESGPSEDSDALRTETLGSTESESVEQSAPGSDADDIGDAWISGESDDDDSDSSVSVSLLSPPVDAQINDTPIVDHAAFAGSIRGWAQRNGVEDDPYILQLAEDVTNRKRLTYWASINPLDHLPTPDADDGRVLRGVAKILLLFRNIGVFVPVALTWLAINKATDAFGLYAEALASDPTFTGQEANFLQFWQSGGPGGSYLADSWRIQHVAFLDAVIILVIIALTLFAGALDAQANVLTEKRRARVDRDRTMMAIEIGRTLHGNRSASPESIGEALALALTDLSEAARNVVVATTRLESSTSAIDEMNPRLEALNQQIANLGRHFATDVVSSVSTLSTSVGTLGATLGGDMNRFLSEVLAGIEEINESFKKTSATVGLGTNQLKDDLEAIHARLAQVAGRR